MKRVLFSIAIVAAGLLVASCGNKSAANAGGADSTAVAEESSANEEEDVIVGPTTLDEERFSIKVPEGWKVVDHRDFFCDLEPVKAPKDHADFGYSVSIVVNWNTDFTPEETIEKDLKGWPDGKRMADQKFGDHTYLYSFYDNGTEDGFHSLLSTSYSDNGGSVDVKIGGYKVEDTPAIQEILSSLKIKLE